MVMQLWRKAGKWQGEVYTGPEMLIRGFVTRMYFDTKSQARTYCLKLGILPYNF